MVLVAMQSLSFAKGSNNWAINLAGDTIKAKMYFDLRDQYDHDRLRIKSDTGKYSLMPWQLKRVKLNGIEYVPLKVKSKHQFGEVISEDYLSLYRIRDTENETSNQFLQKVLVKKTGEISLVSLLSFKGVTKKFLNDCVTESQYEASGDYRLKNIQGIIDEYNQCIESKTSNLVVQRQFNSELDDDIDSFKSNLDKTSLEGKGDLLQMFNDLEEKLREKKEVPSYLTNGIKSILKPNKSLTQQFTTLLDKYSK